MVRFFPHIYFMLLSGLLLCMPVMSQEEVQNEEIEAAPVSEIADSPDEPEEALSVQEEEVEDTGGVLESDEQEETEEPSVEEAVADATQEESPEELNSDDVQEEKSDDTQDVFVGSAEQTVEKTTETPIRKEVRQEQKQHVEGGMAGDLGQYVQKPQEDAIVKEEDLEEGGIDTLNIEGAEGNWLLKRVWLERAETRLDKIKTRVHDIGQERMYFFSERDRVDKAVIDPFFISVGFDQGEFSALIQSLLSDIERVRELEGALTAQEREFLASVGAHKDQLEQLRLDLQAVDELDDSLDDAVRQMMEQVNLSRTYEKEAWQQYKDIAIVLNDKKARDLYYRMGIHLKNITDILQYIREGFSQHFNKTTEKIRLKVDQISQKMQVLQEQGIDIKNRLKGMKRGELSHTSGDTDVEQDDRVDGDGWVSWFIALVSRWYRSIVSWFTS